MLPKNISLQGKVVMVAGDGFRAVGELSQYLAEAGADIIVTCEDKHILDKAVKNIEAAGRKALPIVCSPLNPAQIKKAVSEAVAKMGKIDVLVNSFNREFAKPFMTVTDKEWREVIDYNLSSVYFFTAAAGNHMMQRKTGNIVSIISGLAERGLSNCATYCASQGGVVQFTRALALEWARQNIRVNAIEVGWMGENKSGDASKSVESLAHYIPLRRLGKPEDIGALLIYLASDASSYVTGQSYRVDGGVMAHG